MAVMSDREQDMINAIAFVGFVFGVLLWGLSQVGAGNGSIPYLMAVACGVAYILTKKPEESGGRE